MKPTTLFVIIALTLTGCVLSESPIDHLLENYDTDGDMAFDEEEFEEMLVAFGITPAHEEHGEEDHHDEDGHDERGLVMTRSMGSAVASLKGRRVSVVSRSEDDHDEEHSSAPAAGSEECPFPETIFEEYDTDNSTTLAGDEISFAALQIVAMVDVGCSGEEALAPCDRPSTGTAFGASLGASVVISLISIFGIVLLPFSKNASGQSSLFLNALVAFAVGALVGDAVLHIIPATFGIHGHGGAVSADEHDHEEEGHDEHGSGPVWEEFMTPAVLVLVGIIAFFLLEKFLHIYVLGEGKASSPSESVPVKPSSPSDDGTEAEADEVKYPPIDGSSPAATKASVATFGYMNLIADSLHNLIDGMAIGVSFSASITLGIATSVAIIFHEIPQELGDFAILLKAGFTFRKALFLNFASAAIAIVGAVIGVALGSVSEALTNGILAFTAGGFIYIALVEMLPELIKDHNLKNAIVYAASMLAGMGALALLAVFESAEECLLE